MSFTLSTLSKDAISEQSEQELRDSVVRLTACLEKRKKSKARPGPASYLTTFGERDLRVREVRALLTTVRRQLAAIMFASGAGELEVAAACQVQSSTARNYRHKIWRYR